MAAFKDFSKSRVSGPEEWKVIRESYAETYPVRPLLNRIDELEAALQLFSESANDDWVRLKSARLLGSAPSDATQDRGYARLAGTLKRIAEYQGYDVSALKDMAIEALECSPSSDAGKPALAAKDS
jgi:hypothetical protein